MIKSGYSSSSMNESFLQMRVIETGDSKLGPYKAIKSSDQSKLYDLKNELHQQLGTGNINTDIKKDVLYLYLTKKIDQAKLDKLFSKYKVNESVDMNESMDDQINKLIKSGDQAKLIAHLTSLGHGAVVTDPNDKRTTYHKASNSVKSGWGQRINGERQNVTLMSDTDVAKALLQK